MPRVEFHFDFGSPNAYLAHKIIPDIEKRTGAKFEYVPVLLGGVFKLTNNKPPMVQFGDIKNKMAYENLEMRRFIARHGITKFRMNPFFPVNTLMLMRGAVAAEGEGKLLPLCRRRLPSHVGSAQGHGRSAGHPRGARRIGLRCRPR